MNHGEESSNGSLGAIDAVELDAGKFTVGSRIQTASLPSLEVGPSSLSSKISRKRTVKRLR